MKKIIENIFKKYKIQLNNTQINNFEIYFNFLIEENKKFNLTAITDAEEVVEKHFVDSVLLAKYIPQNAKVIDVGSGAGFPGLPLKILREDLEIVLLDSLQKRVNFLENCINLLKLSKISAVHARVEDYAVKNREGFDVALSRAVAQVPTLSEYLLPLARVGGHAIMYKGAKGEEELVLGAKAIDVLGGKVENVESYTLANGDKRTAIVIKKVARTDKKYPRGKNLPKLKPII